MWLSHRSSGCRYNKILLPFLAIIVHYPDPALLKHTVSLSHTHTLVDSPVPPWLPHLSEWSGLEITWLQINTPEEFVLLLKSARQASEGPPTQAGLYNTSLMESDLHRIPLLSLSVSNNSNGLTFPLIEALQRPAFHTEGRCAVEGIHILWERSEEYVFSSIIAGWFCFSPHRHKAEDENWLFLNRHSKLGWSWFPEKLLQQSAKNKTK